MGGERRADDRRIKAKARRIMRLWFGFRRMCQDGERQAPTEPSAGQLPVADASRSTSNSRLLVGLRGSVSPLTLIAQLLMLGSMSMSGAEPERDLANIVRAFYTESFNTDWRGLETLPGIQWEPLPPAMLGNCLADGGCFTRRGEARIGGRNFTAMATGARTIVTNLYLSCTRSNDASAMLKAIRSVGLSAGLVRCPVLETAGGTNWYRLTGPAIRPGILSIRAVCEGQPCEGYVLSQGDELPALPPADLKLYSEQCAVPPGERLPIATVAPIDRLAQILAALVSLSSGPVLPQWTALQAASTQFVWTSTTPQKMDLAFENDANPFAQTATLSLSGRRFSVLASGSPTQLKTIHIDESGMHPLGEHLLGALYAQGFAVQLVRCGPLYTQSTNNWYSITSSGTHPVMLRQSMRYDGDRVQDAYELRLDNSLPKRDERDRDPGSNGCR